METPEGQKIVIGGHTKVSTAEADLRRQYAPCGEIMSEGAERANLNGAKPMMASATSYDEP